MQKYDKDSLKNSLTLDQVADFVADMGGEPQIMDGFLIARTICHNPAGEGSHKLYYYDNTHLFCCYTDCGERFDIYELTCKIKKIMNIECSLFQAINYVASYFGYASNIPDSEESVEKLQDWNYFENYEKNNSKEKEQIVELKIFDPSILRYLPHPRILSWEEEGIRTSVMEHHGICYNPSSQGIIIPHYDKDNRLIGIRERTLIKEEEQYGKYKPAILAGKMYNHPLSFNLYNLNNSKENIKIIKKAIIFESEKSCLKYASFFGESNDISVAICGSNLITYQVKLLLDLGVDEIIIGLDRQYKEIGDEEYYRWVKKLKEISKKYRSYCNISFLFDVGHLLGYKDAPIDLGKEIFLQLFNSRLDADGHQIKKY